MRDWLTTLRRHWHVIALLAISTVGTPAFMVGGAALASSGGSAVPTSVPHGRCMSARSWSADDGLRPCVSVRRVYEDGSFKAAVTDANGTVRYSIGVGVPDSYECAQHLIAPRLCD